MENTDKLADEIIALSTEAQILGALSDQLTVAMEGVDPEADPVTTTLQLTQAIRSIMAWAAERRDHAVMKQGQILAQLGQKSQ